MAVAATCVALSVPAGASAGLVDDVLNGVRDGVNSLTGGGGGGGAPSAAPTPQAGSPPSYVPPLHGTNPHGEGTVGIVDITPEDTAPLPYDQQGGSEDLVLGRSRGEQDDQGKYHGHITIASLAPLGIEVTEIGVDSSEGEDAHSPLDPLQQNVLNALCDGSGNQLCLGVLQADSVTTKHGSSNSFSTVNANIGDGAITAGVAESDGDISDDGDCQTASGSSAVANADVLGITANAINSSSESTACQDGSTSQNNSSSVLVLGGTGVPLPQAGCENGTPNTNFTALVVVTAVCNADDSNAGQADAPYGVREGLTAFLLPQLGNLVKAGTGATESQAVAPEDTGDECPDPSNPACDNGNECPDPSNADCPSPPDSGTKGAHGEGGKAGPGGPGAGSNGPSAKSGGNLPFTGADVLALALIGGGVMGAGLALMALMDRRRRSARS